MLGSPTSRTVALGIAVIAAAVLGVVFLSATGRLADPPPPIVHVIEVEPVASILRVRHADDMDKPGAMRSVMAQRFMSQEGRTSGPSPDRLAFEWDQPVVIHGVLVSVDIIGIDLVEVAVSIDPVGAYGHADRTGPGFAAQDWLIHTSATTHYSEPTRIDEQAWFPEPFHVEPGSIVAVDAWLGNHNGGPRSISPEVIVFYEWLPVSG